MAKRDPAGEREDRSADEAIQQVLEAEHRAREAVKGCREQAEAIREEARDRARRIAERADRRIDTVHQRCEGALQAELEAIAERERAEQGEAAAPYDDATVTAAVRRLAATLTDGEASRGGEDTDR